MVFSVLFKKKKLFKAYSSFFIDLLLKIFCPNVQSSQELDNELLLQNFKMVYQEMDWNFAAVHFSVKFLLLKSFETPCEFVQVILSFD